MDSMPKPSEAVKPEEPQFTPGPWEVHTSDLGRVWIHEVSPQRGHVVICDIPGDMETIEGEIWWNAHLISAAPELYAACEEAGLQIPNHPDSRLCKMIYSALRKARGQK